jgi:hypothetical protein
MLNPTKPMAASSSYLVLESKIADYTRRTTKPANEIQHQLDHCSRRDAAVGMQKFFE